MTSHDRKKGSKINVADRVLLDQLLSWIIIEIFIKKIFLFNFNKNSFNKNSFNTKNYQKFNNRLTLKQEKFKSNKISFLNLQLYIKIILDLYFLNDENLNYLKWDLKRKERRNHYFLTQSPIDIFK